MPAHTMTWMITGADSGIGLALQAQLQPTRRRVMAFSEAALPLTDTPHLTSLLTQIRPSLLFLTTPQLASGATSVLPLSALTAIARWSAVHEATIVLLSSAQVFKGAMQSYHEQHIIHAESEDARQQLAQEDTLLSLCPQAHIVRLGSLFNDTHLMRWQQRFEQDEPLLAGHLWCTPTPTHDAAAQLIQLAHMLEEGEALPERIHLGSTPALSEIAMVKTLYDAMTTVVDLPPLQLSAAIGQRHTEPALSSQVAELIGIPPRDWRDTLIEMLSPQAVRRSYTTKL